MQSAAQQNPLLKQSMFWNGVASHVFTYVFLNYECPMKEKMLACPLTNALAIDCRSEWQGEGKTRRQRQRGLRSRGVVSAPGSTEESHKHDQSHKSGEKSALDTRNGVSHINAGNQRVPGNAALKDQAHSLLLLCLNPVYLGGE